VSLILLLSFDDVGAAFEAPLAADAIILTLTADAAPRMFGAEVAVRNGGLPRGVIVRPFMREARGDVELATMAAEAEVAQFEAEVEIS
jgi:hypothetical protein